MSMRDAQVGIFLGQLLGAGIVVYVIHRIRAAWRKNRAALSAPPAPKSPTAN